MLARLEVYAIHPRHEIEHMCDSRMNGRRIFAPSFFYLIGLKIVVAGINSRKPVPVALS